MMKTYRDEFVPGVRVRVEAGPNEGADHEFNGCTGTIVKYGLWTAVKIDKLPPYWRNPAVLCSHNLRTLREEA